MATKNTATNLTGRQEEAVSAAWDDLLNGLAEDLELNPAQAAIVIKMLKARLDRLDHLDLVLDEDDGDDE